MIVHVFQLSSGNVYEAGQLNALCVLELMNHALQLLREERCRVAHAPKPQLSPKHLQEKCQQMARTLQNLHLIRYTLTHTGLINLDRFHFERWVSISVNPQYLFRSCDG